MSTQKSNLNRRQFLILSGMSLRALALNACGSPATTESGIEPTTMPESASSDPQRGGTLRIAFPDSFGDLNPWSLFLVTEAIFTLTIYESLVRYDDTFTLQPALAESWQNSDDGLSWTFKLRKGVTFHDGSPFSAQDVVYSFEQILDPDNGFIGGRTLSFVHSVEAVDDFTVRFNLSRPNMDLPIILAIPITSAMIAPAGQTVETLIENPVGTGPFKFKEHIPLERAVVTRNENYWNDRLPYLDEIQLLYIPEIATQVAALTSGDIDMMWQLTTESIAALAGVADIEVVEISASSYQPIVMRIDTEPFTDNRVRQAMKYLIDRNAFVQVVLQGTGIVGNDQPAVPGTPFAANLSPYPQDIDKAKALLAEAGYPDGFETTLVTSKARPGMAESAVVFQEMAKQVGVTVNIEQLPPDSYWAEYLNYPLSTTNYPATPSADILLTLSYHSQGPWNESGMQNEKLDQLIEQARAEPDETERQTLYTQVQRIIQEEGGIIVPYFRSAFYAHHSKVQGVIYPPPADLQMHKIWFK